MQLKYDNITISGSIGVGTSTLMNNLRPYLKPMGWKFKSTGQIIRDYTKEKIMPSATLVSDEFDREIEKTAKNLLLNQKHWAIEAWLSGFIAKDMKNVLRILLVCSNDALRVDRVVNRDKITIEQAKKNIRLRHEQNFGKWKRLYGNYNFFNTKYFNIIIDTYSSGQLETTGKVLDMLGFNNQKVKNTKS